MTFLQNQAITALPNVLRDQTVPNTLAGVIDPAAVVRRATSLRAVVVGLAALFVGALIGLAAIVSRSG